MLDWGNCFDCTHTASCNWITNKAVHTPGRPPTKLSLVPLLQQTNLRKTNGPEGCRGAKRRFAQNGVKSKSGTDLACRQAILHYKIEILESP